MYLPQNSDTDFRIKPLHPSHFGVRHTLTYPAQTRHTASHTPCVTYTLQTPHLPSCIPYVPSHTNIIKYMAWNLTLKYFSTETWHCPWTRLMHQRRSGDSDQWIGLR